MSEKKTLMCYRNGARGDFLMSLISGSIREVYNELFAVPLYPNFIKMHDFGDVWYGNAEDQINSISDITRYNAFRIKIEDFDDAQLIIYLMNYKMPFKGITVNDPAELLSSISSSFLKCIEFEINFRPHDSLFIEVIPFKKIFDFDFLMEFCQRHSKQIWSNEDLSKIKQNILINEKLKIQMHNSKNFDINIVNAYKYMRSNNEKFSEFPDHIDLLSDWEFLNGR